MIFNEKISKGFIDLHFSFLPNFGKAGNRSTTMG
jgi:hypothetical protein